MNHHSGGLYVHRSTCGLWELRTARRTLGMYETKQHAKRARRRLLRRGRR